MNIISAILDVSKLRPSTPNPVLFLNCVAASEKQAAHFRISLFTSFHIPKRTFDVICVYMIDNRSFSEV